MGSSSQNINPQFDKLQSSKAFKKEIKELKNKAQQTRVKNPFPYKVFPDKVQNIIKQTNKCLGFPIDYIGASMLYATSIAIGNSCKIKLMNGYEQNAVLYLAIVGRAGANKSHPLSFAVKPIEKYSEQLYSKYETSKKEYDQKLKKANNEKKELTKPTLQKFLLSDFTPEALTKVHKTNERGLGVYVDELAGWFKNFNRYNSGSEMEMWLSIWSGKPINVERKNDEPILINSPFISVGGTIQPQIISKELAKDQKQNNGFIDRILFAFPENLKKESWSETEINESTINCWEEIIFKLLDLPIPMNDIGKLKPKILQFDDKAKNRIFDWQKKITDISNQPQNDDVSGLYAKFEVYAIRLSLILQMLYYACDDGSKNTVGLDAVEGAIKLIEYFKNTAFKVNNLVFNNNPLDQVTTQKQALYSALPEQFETKKAVEIGVSFDMSESTVKRFLTDKNLFKRVKQGIYEKLL